MNVSLEFKKIQQQFEKLKNQRRAEQEKRYLRSTFQFYGSGMVAMEKIAKDFFQTHKDLSKKDLWLLVNKFWQSGWHELRGLAVNLLRKYPKFLDYSALPRLEEMLRQSINWDQVDEISAHLVGLVLAKDKRGYSYLKKWIKDKNFWVRRAALLSQLLLFRAGEGDRKLFYLFAEKLMDESWQNFESWAGNHPEKMGRWFIQKAIGWVLREMSKKWPDEVYQFLQKNKRKMSSLSFREGSRKLAESYRKQLI